MRGCRCGAQRRCLIGGFWAPARECVRAVTEPRACALPATDHILSARGAVRGAQMSGPPPALGRKKAMGEAEKQATLKVRA